MRIKTLLSVNPSGWLQTCATAMLVAEDGSSFVNTCDLVLSTNVT
jgi:hypothetical protein